MEESEMKKRERPLAAEEVTRMLDLTPRPRRGFDRTASGLPVALGLCCAALLFTGTLAGCGRGGSETAQGPVKQASGPPGPPAAAAPGSQELSEEAKQITFFTRRAGDRGNYVALRKYLNDDYRFTGPDHKTAEHLNGDQAIAKWQEHPELLATLVTIVDKGCLPDGTEHVVCPPESLNDAAYKGYVAGYTHQKAAGDWKMTSFDNRGQ
jgi:hypothetical protein